MDEEIKKPVIGYTAGVFDMFHVGHLNILRKSKELCDYLVVGITTDDLCYQRKKKKPIICEADRYKIVESIRYVDKVVFQTDMDKLEVVKRIGANVVFVGSDWKGSEAWNKYEQEFAQVGCKVIYLDYTDGISSSIIREKMNSR